MPKRTRRPQARPDEILDAALAVFSEKGFAGARVADIAVRAGLSKGAGRSWGSAYTARVQDKPVKVCDLEQSLLRLEELNAWHIVQHLRIEHRCGLRQHFQFEPGGSEQAPQR
jgi:hypothetical protein